MGYNTTKIPKLTGRRTPLEVNEAVVHAVVCVRITASNQQESVKAASISPLQRQNNQKNMMG